MLIYLLFLLLKEMAVAVGGLKYKMVDDDELCCHFLYLWRKF